MDKLKRKLNTLVIQKEDGDQGVLPLIRQSETLELVKHCQSHRQASDILGFVHTDLIFVNVDDCAEHQLTELLDTQPNGIFIWLTRNLTYKINLQDPRLFDCLILPMTEARFKLVERRISEHFLFHSKSEAIPGEVSGPTMLVKSGSEHHQLKAADIIYIESDGEYLKYHTQHGRFMALGSLRRLAKGLSSDFVQVHRSYVVNRNYVMAKKRQQLELIGNRIIPIGKTYRNAFQFISSAVLL